MRQISDHIFAEEFLFERDIATPLLPSPYNEYPFMIIENFLNDAACKAIVDSIKKSNDAIEAKLRSRKKKLNPKIRKTKIYTLRGVHKKLYDSAMLAIRPEIEAFFALSLTLSTKPQVLEYTKGSFYRPHADDSSFLLDGNGVLLGFKQVTPERKITTVFFGTDFSEVPSTPYQFSGGELAFSYFKDAEGLPFEYKPKMGSLLVFASNPIYTHEVKEVKEGYRLTIAQWHDALL